MKINEIKVSVPEGANDLALAQTPGENAGDSLNNQIAGTPETEKEAAVASSALVRSRILSLEPQGSNLVMRGYNKDKHGDPILSKEFVKSAIQYLQYWANDDLINLPRWNVETSKWEGDHQPEKQP